jgi:hypothetical protein
MQSIEQFENIIGMDLCAAIAEVTHTAICTKRLPHNVPDYSKHDKTVLLDALIARLENVKTRINLEIA